jgi:thioester reductase-like protein
MKNIVLLTGATGLVGQSLVSRIIQADNDTLLVLLIRGNSDGEVNNRFDKLFSSLSSSVNHEHTRAHIRAVRGDITLNQLGMGDAVYHDLASKVTHIIHSAASIKFHQSLEQTRAVNLYGTKKVIGLARQARAAGRLKRVAYISTAFVSGKRSGVIKENELDCGQQFSNTYEQAKFEAEQFLGRLSGILPITIFRPSIIVGDSKTGMTPAFNSLYTPLKFISRGLVSMMPGSRNTLLDIVPVDFVCDALCHIFFKSNKSVGKTYHLASGKEKSPKTGEVADLAVDYFNQTLTQKLIPQIKFFPKKLYDAEKRLINKRERRTIEALKGYMPYLEINTFFDTTNTSAILQSTDITPPHFKQYYKPLLQYCLLTNWGQQEINSMSVQLNQQAVP